MGPSRIASSTSRHVGARRHSSRTCTGSRMRRRLANICSTSRPRITVIPFASSLARLTSALARDREGLAATVAANVAKYEAAAAANHVVAAQRPPRARAFRDRLCRRHVWRSASTSCRSPRTSCSPPFCPAIGITSPSSTMKLLVAHPGQLEPLPFQRSSTRVQCGSRLPAPSFPSATPFDRLRHFIDRNILPERGKRDKLSMTLRNGQPALVYIRERDGQTEYWFPNDLFEEVVGGSREAEALKKDLHVRGLLETAQRGTASATWSRGLCRMARGPSSLSYRHKREEAVAAG